MVLLLCLAFLCVGQVYSIEGYDCESARSFPKQSSHYMGGYLGRKDVQMFINGIVSQGDFNREELELILRKARKTVRVLSLISQSIEVLGGRDDYRNIFLTDEHVMKGVTFWQRNKHILAKVEEEFSVPAEVIVATLGVEISYGVENGGFSILDALATLSFDYSPKSDFFKKELEAFLRIVKDFELKQPEKYKGSYVGALGVPRLMSSSFNMYAKSYLGKGKPNIWDNEDDAIISVANFLQKNGWQEKMPVAIAAKVSNDNNDMFMTLDFRPDKSIGQCLQGGWQPCSPLPPGLGNVSTIRLMMPHGQEFWLGSKNLHVITLYNNSKLFGLVIHQLSVALKSSYLLAARTRVKMLVREIVMN